MYTNTDQIGIDILLLVMVVVLMLALLVFLIGPNLKQQ